MREELSEPCTDRLNMDEDLLIDWESKFEEHMKILEEEKKKKRDERLEMSVKMRAGWELTRLCRDYI